MVGNTKNMCRIIITLTYKIAFIAIKDKYLFYVYKIFKNIKFN